MPSMWNCTWGLSRSLWTLQLIISDNLHIRHYKHLYTAHIPSTKSHSRSVKIFIRFFCLATGWTVRGSNPGGGEILRTRPDRPWGLPSLLYNGYRVSFPGVKRPGRGVDHPPSSSVRVKERVEPLWAFMACYRVNSLLSVHTFWMAIQLYFH
jgi:hypothetical protein